MNTVSNYSEGHLDNREVGLFSTIFFYLFEMFWTQSHSHIAHCVTFWDVHLLPKQCEMKCVSCKIVRPLCLSANLLESLSFKFLVNLNESCTSQPVVVR